MLTLPNPFSAVQTPVAIGSAFVGLQLSVGSIIYSIKWFSGKIDDGSALREFWATDASKPITGIETNLYKLYVLGFLLFPTTVYYMGLYHLQQHQPLCAALAWRIAGLNQLIYGFRLAFGGMSIFKAEWRAGAVISHSCTGVVLLALASKLDS
eukprot:TRINITY_DN12453_c0_g3_i1.p1 TRINITY_DN12453_c0_g3~~TRINITY_DN12453_c0_g3_i1.p1  ORF type:complete len:153 (+),score=0.38 TRINITY_DN12453_c0_g3_i1:122-580(+)